MFNYIISGNFLLNIFFITFPLMFYQFVLNEKPKSLLKHFLVYIIFTIPVILCMIFPVVKSDGFLFDMRLIPLIMACLYGNAFTSLLVGLTLIVTRSMIGGGDGLLLSVISTGLAYVFLLPSFRKYHVLSLPHKIVFMFVFSFIAKFTGKFVYWEFINPQYTQLGYAAVFYLLHSSFMALSIYIIEAIKNNMKLRNEIIESEKLRVASVISASVAHEIRNPLTTVRGFIQLSSTSPEINEDKRRQYGQISLEELDRAEQIISDYLSLARPHPEHVEVIDMSDEMIYISSVLSSYAALKGVQIMIDAEQTPKIMGDRQKLRQALINIIKNGIEAMDQGGMLKLKSKVRNRKVIVTVLDTGVGMTVEEINRLGTPYFSSKEKGTGLGTMVSFSIIKNMNGKIQVHSKKGKGTVFEITFPEVG